MTQEERVSRPSVLFFFRARERKGETESSQQPPRSRPFAPDLYPRLFPHFNLPDPSLSKAPSQCCRISPFERQKVEVFFFVRKIKRQKKEVREHYLREDIYCGAHTCEVCDRSSTHLSSSASIVLIVDTNVVLHQGSTEILAGSCLCCLLLKLSPPLSRSLSVSTLNLY